MKMKKLFGICLVALSALISVHLQAQEVETLVLIDTDTVSYTHLDVYKRQQYSCQDST